MNTILLTKPFFRDFKEEEILFVSDIEEFNKDVTEDLLINITNKKIKLIVFIGDILSFLDEDTIIIKILTNNENHLIIIEMAYDLAGVETPFKKDDYSIETCEFITSIIGEYVSKKLYAKYGTNLELFKTFMKYCNDKLIDVIYYRGNHDSILNNIYFYSRFVPFFKEIRDIPNLRFGVNLIQIQLNPNLFLLGINSQKTDLVRNYPFLRMFCEKMGKIENVENTIFVSHCPGTSKYKNLGSDDITNLKKLHKFKKHYHGHCRDYYGKYVEEGIETESVHYQNYKMQK